MILYDLYCNAGMFAAVYISQSMVQCRSAMVEMQVGVMRLWVMR